MRIDAPPLFSQVMEVWQRSFSYMAFMHWPSHLPKARWRCLSSQQPDPYLVTADSPEQMKP